VPRDVFIAAVSPRLSRPGSPDLVALRVSVTGERSGKPEEVRFELLDFFDPRLGISAMMRTTGYSLALTALMQADGSITARGVHTPDQAVPFEEYVAGLAEFGVKIVVAATP
jgi:lysine 6-dehydrogenase